MKTITLAISLFFLAGCSSPKSIAVSPVNDNISTDSYKLQAGDKVELIVMQRTELSGEYTIGPDGSIAIPLSENIAIVNLTREEAEKKIASGIRKYYSPISIMLKIISFQNDQLFVILGEVKNPGVYPIVNQLSVLKALGEAGGLTQNADQKRILLIRKNNVGEVYEIDLKSILENGNLDQDYVLQNNDLIFVKRHKFSTLLKPINQIMPAIQFGFMVFLSLYTSN